MKQLLTSIVKSLVDRPSKVIVTQIDGAKTLVFELRCDEQDVGKIIGKNGKTVSSIRTLLGALASKERRKVIIEVVY